MSKNPFLRQLRERGQLSQTELAELLGISQAGISRYECGVEYPPLPVALGYYVVFGRALHSCFAALYDAVENAVINKGAALERTLRGREDGASASKRGVLEKMMSRAVSRTGA